MNERQSGRQVTVLSGLVFALSLAALVILEVTGRSTAALMALVGPVIAALFLASHVDRRTNEQNVVIGKIAEQTNGVLDQRIKESTAEAIREILPTLDRREE